MTWGTQEHTFRVKIFLSFRHLICCCIAPRAEVLQDGLDLLEVLSGELTRRGCPFALFGLRHLRKCVKCADCGCGEEIFRLLDWNLDFGSYKIRCLLCRCPLPTLENPLALALSQVHQRRNINLDFDNERERKANHRAATSSSIPLEYDRLQP